MKVSQILISKRLNFNVIGYKSIKVDTISNQNILQFINPKDLKDYAKGVWTLPPTLRLGDKNKAKYSNIGESDRMTLRFIKPI